MTSVEEAMKSSKRKPAKAAVAMKRYRAPTAAEGADGERAHRPRTKVLSAHVKRDIARRLVEMFGAWAKAVKYKPGEANFAQKTRAQIKSKSEGVKLGFSVPPETMTTLDRLVDTYGRKKNFIATWCIGNGIVEVTVHQLVAEYPDIRPSLSLVSLLAFRKGLERFANEIEPPLPSIASDRSAAE